MIKKKMQQPYYISIYCATVIVQAKVEIREKAAAKDNCETAIL